ncbi:indole-3-glycerol-phosphate synthase [uncultured Mailhella sp.]|uniref:indole-3-glycerol-phosphate synthase n=1 Tax=uncultured Mailhella sp. TaxID=1981031 RepID=UPI0026152BD5|nr:indole-3-glycerol-phosphate synthase [uncultured Mailhella sp.]
MELERFYQAKQAEIAALERMDVPEPWPLPRPSFLQALEGGRGGPLPVVAEFKRASPSRGSICENLEPEEAAREYIENGASALSILTEETYFHGHLSFIRRIAAMMETERALDGDGLAHGKEMAFLPSVPMLRKDFLFHPAQIAATLATPASALLLIVRLTPDARVLRDLREQAERGGVQAVVEVFSAGDLALARESGARIIQVNARDLETLKVDREACLRFIGEQPPRGNERWIAASGMSCREDLEAAAAAGYHAALVGSALMEHGTPGADLRRLLRGRGGEDVD